VEAWLNSNEDLNNDWEQMDETQRSDFLTNLYQRIKTSIQVPGVVYDRPQADDRLHGVSRSGPRVIRMWKWVAAACIILVTGYGIWKVTGHRLQDTGSRTQVAKTHDVPAPANTRAVITLADGSKVYLDSANNGTIAQQNNVSVVKNEKGEIIYSPDHPITGSPITYNTLSNPRGSKVISLTLSDGTKVWLNSESSLKYPIAFNASTREVEITGEAYFEVKHNAKQPFKVHLPNGSVVEDLGTAFNINAYTDEQDIKTTLVEGSLRVFASSASSAVKLVPGQQSVINRSSPDHQITRSPDIDEVLAWKNGMFLLDNTDLPTIMRQISRWYDVDVVYEGKIPGAKFVGGVSKNLPLSKVLELLRSNGIETRLEGKKIIVQ
jgi:ferric-dicitrate binding protein FerR (iron transport regulator)